MKLISFAISSYLSLKKYIYIMKNLCTVDKFEWDQYM